MRSNRLTWLVFAGLVVLMQPPAPAAAQARQPESLSTQEHIPQKFSSPQDAIKTFFTALKDKDFDLAWESLSKPSQDRFVRMLAASRRISLAQARELFDKDKDAVKLGFWNHLRDRSKIVPLVQDAVYVLTDQKNGQAMVELKSAGNTYHLKAVLEGYNWRMGYMESGLPEAPNPVGIPSPETRP